MRLGLAILAFMFSLVALLACLAVALEGYGVTAGLLPVLRSNGGVTPFGALLLIAAVPLCPLFTWAGISFLNGPHA
jgi:hypothetical protein